MKAKTLNFRKKLIEFYIAFSRFKKAEDFIIHPYELNRFDFTGTLNTLKSIQSESKRLKFVGLRFLKSIVNSNHSVEYKQTAKKVLEEYGP